MKRFIVFVLFLLFISGCAGYGIVVRPDVYVSGDFGPPGWWHGPHPGPFWEYSVLTAVNGSPCEQKIIQDGIEKGTISPGKHLRLLIKNYYNESRQVSMVAVAYYAGRHVSVTTQTFYFYGSTRHRQSETWKITKCARGRDP